MAKGSRSGSRRARTVNAYTVPNAPQSATPTSTIATGFDSMTDDQKATVMANAIAQGVPDHLANNDYQKLLYNSELEDKPDIVDDATFTKLAKNKQVFYRTVNAVYDSKHDRNYTAPDIAKQIMGGTFTRVSDTGGSAYGRGLYFADDRGSSIAYGNTRGNINKTAVVKAILSPTAKVIDYNKAQRGMQQEMYTNSKLSNILRKADGPSRVSIYALAKGYNVISSGGWGGYYNVLNRSALVMSSDISQM